MDQPKKLSNLLHAMCTVSDVPITVKVRTSYRKQPNIVERDVLTQLSATGVQLVTVHGRTKEQRYQKLSDWSYINRKQKEKQQT